MVRLEFDDNFTTMLNGMKKVANRYPSDVNSFLSKETKNIANSIASKQDPRWEQKITHSPYVGTPKNPWRPFREGRYIINRERDGIKTWWLINNWMFYERFVNDGHAIRRKKRGPAIGYAKPTHHIERGFDEYSPKLENNFDKFVEGHLL